MPVQSDLTLNTSKFAPSSIPPEIAKLNEHIIKVMEENPKWYEAPPDTGKCLVIETGKNETIPSRVKGQDIPCRIFLPDSGKPKGVFIHIHSGGWVLQSEAYQDYLLNFMTQKANLAVVSVGYRLAPEDPFPAGPNDCYDAAEYLVKNSKSRFGAPLLFIGGESAGAHLSVLTLLHLHKAIPTFKFRALILHFGSYDLSSFLPAVHNFKKPLIIDYPIMQAYINAFLPNTTPEERRDPSISHFFADWMSIAQEMKGGLPSALFTCGTEDPLLDDSVMMTTKWLMVGSEATLKIYPGAPHRFILFDEKLLKAAGEGLRDLEQYLLEKL